MNLDRCPDTLSLLLHPSFKASENLPRESISIPGFFRLSDCIVAYSGHLVNTAWALDSDHLGCDPGSASDKLGDHVQVLHAFRAPVSLEIRWRGCNVPTLRAKF